MPPARTARIVKVMCGIAGIYARPGSEARQELLLTMAGELRHRGPDGTGLYVDGAFGMTNNRLAIVDLAGGDQPLSNEDGRYWVMQNGELYNYVELIDELESLGHRFATRSDTEVIAHAYEEWGPACLERMNGDFAFAVWDRRERELFLARDRFGIRPLFVAELGDDLVFASEAKAILRHPEARRELDPAGLVETFTTWCVSPDGSSFPGIRELAPAHYIVAGPEGIREERRWWDLRFSDAGDVSPAERVALAEELDALLADATRLRLRADVPVAAYLSGGLDSSAIVALALEQMDETLYSFGIGFEDERFDESAYQDRLAGDQGLSLTRVTVGARDIAELLPRTIEMSEKPTLRTAPAPLLRLSRAVREAGLKVVTTGEGADELFAGYDVFRENKVRHFWAREPESTLRPLLLTRLNAFIGKDLKRSGAFLVGFYRKGLTETDDPLYSHRLRFANTSRLLGLLDGDVVAQAAGRGDPAERLEARLPVLVRRDDPARPGAVPRDLDLPGELPAALAGRPDADGPLDRRPLPVPRLPGRRVRGRPSGRAQAPRAEREVPAAEVGRASPARRDRRPQEAPVPRADRGRVRRATTRPATSASCSRRIVSLRPGSSTRRQSSGSCASARRARRATRSPRRTRWRSSACSRR